MNPAAPAHNPPRKEPAMTTATAPAFVTVDILTRDHDDAPIVTITLTGEPITSGLAITPATSEQGFAGGWTITHQPSGHCIGKLNHCLACLRRAGRVLAEADVDWTRPKDQVVADPAAVEAVKVMLQELDWCLGATCGTGC